MIGRTWYRRGPSYWLRRVAMAAGLLALTAFAGFVAVALFEGAVSGLPDTGRRVCYIAQGVASVVGIVWGWIAGRLQIRERLANPPTPAQSRSRQRTARTRGASAVSRRGLMLLLLPVLPAVIAYFLGSVCAGMFVRKLPSEVGAHRALAA